VTQLTFLAIFMPLFKPIWEDLDVSLSGKLDTVPGAPTGLPRDEKGEQNVRFDEFQHPLVAPRASSGPVGVPIGIKYRKLGILEVISHPSSGMEVGSGGISDPKIGIFGAKLFQNGPNLRSGV
jgi:hypothetical protein